MANKFLIPLNTKAWLELYNTSHLQGQALPMQSNKYVSLFMIRENLTC